MSIVSVLADTARSLVKQRRFDRMLERTVGAASQWGSEEAVLAVAHLGLRTVIDAPPEPLGKGAPDLVAIKAADARRLALMLPCLREHGAQALSAAADIASIDPRDEAAFSLYLAVFWLVHRRTIVALKALGATNIALHMSCRPRLSRAMESVSSFQAIPGASLQHITLVGNGEECAYHYADGLLEVPAADGYDQLPMMMARAYAMLAIACDPRCVLKLDDDHRIGDPAALMRLIEQCGRSRGALQTGHVYFTPQPSGHNRGWHYGKCPEQACNFRPMTYPTPMSWVSGEHGYLLNAAALRRFPWAVLCYRDWLGSILYEDIAVGEIGARLGIRVQHVPLARAVSAVQSY